MHPTVESSSAVCTTPGSQVIKISQKAPRCAFHCGVKLCSVHPSAESSSSVCITRRSQMAHRGVKIEIFVSLWLLLKGQSREILLGVNTSIIDDNNWILLLFSKTKILIRSVMHTAEPNFLNFVIEYLGETETETVAKMCLNHEKKWRSKIWWHTPVKKIVLFKTNYFLWKNKVLRINFQLYEVFLDIEYKIYDNIQPESKYLQFIILYTCVCLRCRTRIQAKYCQNEKVHFNKSYMYIMYSNLGKTQ